MTVKDPVSAFVLETADTQIDLDGTNAPALIINHIASGKHVEFKSKMKIRSFKDEFKAEYNSERVFGRMDPIVTYQGTGRTITLGFDIGTLKAGPMAAILAAATRLMQFQYPVYEDPGNAMSLSRPPLVYVSFGNYIRAGSGGPLLCAMQGFSYSPFDKFDRAYNPNIERVNGDGKYHIIPSRISFDMNFIVLHEQPPAWALNKKTQKIDWIGGDKFGKVDFGATYDGTKVGQQTKKDDAGKETITQVTAGMTQTEIYNDEVLRDTLPQAEIDKVFKQLQAAEAAGQ